MSPPRIRRAAANLTAEALGHMPGRFRIVQALGSSYSLRCVLFHHVANMETPFTRGIDVTITTRNFENALRFLAEHYTPVRLQDVLSSNDSRALPPRPVLVTFDDAYASVFETAAPLCRKYGIPAIFFVNGACLDNRQLALDNLVCYVANEAGLETVNVAAREIGEATPEVHALPEVFTCLLPALSLPAREAFRNALLRLIQVDDRDLAREAGLYLTSSQLRELAALDFEIGNHTYTHVNCRCLQLDDFSPEIDRNRRVLEQTAGTPVRSFSVPYGSSRDLTPILLAHLQRSGYQAAFLVESAANRTNSDMFRLNRISLKAQGDSSLFSEIEVLPRLRVIRNWSLACLSNRSRIQ